MTTPSTHIRIFLVDDHAVVRGGLRAMLETQPGFEVVGESTDAEQALQKLPGAGVDVVLMDIEMPGIGGIEGVCRLKVQRPDLPVVMLTTHGGGYVAEAMEAGASGYIVKTTSIQQLVQAVWAAHLGQTPIDPSVTGVLFGNISELRKAQGKSLLTDRQREILQMAAGGHTYGEIAAELYMSVTTVNRDMRTIFNRLGVNDATHAVAEGYRRGILK